MKLTLSISSRNAAMSEFAAVPSVPPVSEIPAADSREVPSEAVNVMYLLSVRAETSVTPSNASTVEPSR